MIGKRNIYLIGVFVLNKVFNYIPTFFMKNNLIRLFKFKIGKYSYIHTPVKFFTIGKLIIGNNSTINSGCYLDCRRKITIGNNVNISHDTKIYTLGHDINDPYAKEKGAEVKIDDNAFIFSNVLIMPGVHIGEGAVVYAGSVVTKSIEPYTIVGGNPAKPIGIRNKEIKYKLNYKHWFAL